MTPLADITILPSVDSTNIYAMGQVHAHMAKHGQVYFALEQTAGRGQRGRQWLSAPGTNIMMSMVFRLNGQGSENQVSFNMAMAMACFDLYNARAGGDVSVKWPNDIYWRDRKAGGILIENQVKEGRWSWAIVGVGLNINQTQFDPSISRKPVSLKQVIGRETDLLEILNDLITKLHTRFGQWQSAPEQVMFEYGQALFQKDQKIKLKKDNRVFEAVVKGVDAFGRLQVYTTMDEYYTHGEVEWL